MTDAIREYSREERIKNIELALNNVPESLPKDLYIDCDWPEWKELICLGAKEESKSYTVIYRDTDGELKEAWHWISEMNMEYIKNKYKHQKKEIYLFVPMALPFGERLAQMKGNSKNDR